MKRKNESQKVIRIPIMVPVVMAIIISIIATVLIGKELITNAARYTAANALTTEDGRFEYEVLEDGTIEITDYLGTESYVTIPESIDGKTVTSIGNGAFYYCTNLINVDISNGIKNIGAWAFEECVNLKNIEIPESVTSIGLDLFWNCINLRNINVNKNNTVFMSENGILFNKEKTEIIKYPAGKENTKYTLPEGITVIGYAAFDCAENLQIVNIPEGVTSIADYAFDGCTSLTSIKIPESVIQIGDEAFGYCTNLNSVELPKNEINYMDWNSDYYTFYSSRIITAINVENAITCEIELPDIIKRAMDENDQLYASEEFELSNCTLSEDKTKLVVDVEKVKEENASIYIDGGILRGLLFEIVPSGTVTYSEESDWCDGLSPFKINVTAILHLAEGEQITNNDGKNAYVFSKNGEFTFEYTDANGNVKTSKAVVDWLWDITVLGNYDIIADIQPKTTVSQLKTMMKIEDIGEDIKVYSKDNEELAETDLVGTGMQLKYIEEDETETYTYTLVIKGDVNGDGKSDFKDLTKINSYRLNKKTLEDKYLIASDVNDDGIVDFKDLVKINKFRLNKITEL